MEAMGIIRELGDRANVGYGLDVLARLAVVERRYDRALRLAGAARSLRSAIGTASISLWQELVDRDLDLARRILGTEAAAEEWARGAAMTWEEALVLGLAAPDPAAPGPPGEGSAPLSRRETEIAELVARGLSNPEIAEHLFIARRTAEAHVQHILDKLGLSSRVEIAAWVIERRFRTDGEP